LSFSATYPRSDLMMSRLRLFAPTQKINMNQKDELYS
jgi:hypothetical protein